MKGHEALLGTLAVTTLLLAAACSNTAEGVKEDSRQNAETARQEAQQVKEASQDTAQELGEKAEAIGAKVAEGAKAVGQELKEGAQAVGSEVGAKKQTVDVRAALMLDKSIDGSHIDVDTDADTKTVTLKGTVPTAAQKTAAEKLARENAEGYAVRNLLTILKAS